MRRFFYGATQFRFLLFLPTRSGEAVFQSKLTAFDHAAARELRLRWRRRDFDPACGMSTFSFLVRRRRHDVDDEVDQIHRMGRSDCSGIPCSDNR